MINRKITLISLACFIGLASFGQYRDSIVFAAMTDELNRNMEELVEEEKQPPFFISYSCDLGFGTAITASQGSIYYASQYPYGSTGVRVMVGDYDFNDESLNSSNSSYGYNQYGQNQVPIKEDYYGLRKIFWKSTDQTYRSAAESYEDHVKLLEKEELTIDETPHRSFAKVEVEQYEEPGDYLIVDQKEWENNLKKYTSEFKNYKDLESSGATFNVYSTKHFFVSSEGARIKTIRNQFELTLNASMLGTNGESMYAVKEYNAESANQMPSMATIQNDIQSMHEELLQRKSAQEYDDEYEGPVLVLGSSAATFLNMSLGSYLNANTSVKNPSDEYGYTYKSTSIEDEIGEVYTNELVSISIEPSRREFEGTPLLGSYDFDSEGVRPIESLNLIEHGILKATRCSRTVSKEIHKPTGTNDGPGVIVSEVDKTVPISKMKKKLIKAAKSKKLDYAVVVRARATSGYNNIREIYKVDLKTGEETLLDGAVLTGLDRTGIENLVLASEEKAAYNVSNGYSRNITSCIAPKALLVENISLSGETMSFKAQPAIVQNPLIESKNQDAE